MSSNSRTTLMKKNIIVSFFLKGLSILISFILVPMTLHYLTSYEYGVWLTLSSILQWLDYFDIGLGNGLRNKLTESIANKDFKLGRVYVSTTFCYLFFIVIVVFISYVSLNGFLQWDKILNTESHPIQHINEIVLIIFTMCCVNFVMKTIGIIHVSFQKPMVNNFISVSGQLLSLIIIYILTLTTDGSLAKVAIAFTVCPFIAYAVAYPYTFWYKYKELSPSYKYVDFKYGKDLVGLGVKFFIIQIVCLILFTTSNIIISQLFTPREVTPYNIAFKYVNSVYMLFLIIQTPLWSAITDAYAKKDYLWIVKTINKQIRIWIICVFGIIFLICVKSILLHIWIGDGVNISYSLVTILGLYQMLLMLSMIYGSFGNGIGHLNIQVYAAIAQGILYIPLAILLTKPFGLNGVALALMIVSLITPFVQVRDYYRTIKEWKIIK